MLGYLRDKAAEKARKKFIENCIKFDTPRLQTEKYPESVRVEADVVYGAHELDVYFPSTIKSSNSAYFLIHGGAFVYGSKELDKRFGMCLSEESGLPVVNVNYTLMPDSDLKQVLSELVEAATFACNKYGFTDLHYIGDSAGGYLTLIMGLLTNSAEVRADLGLPDSIPMKAVSVNPVCGSYLVDKKTFPGCYFESSKSGELPSYVYNLFDLVKKVGSPRAAIVTGDQDFLRKENIKLKKFYDELGIKAEFIDAVSNSEEQAFHVFPIAQPTKPQAHKAIEMFVRNAIG